MSELLNLLREEAVSLLDHQLPTTEELRPVVAALVNRLERLEQRLVGKLEPAPDVEPVVQPEAANSVAPGPHVQSPSPSADAPEASAAPAEVSSPGPEPESEPKFEPDNPELEAAKRQLAEAQARVDELKRADEASS